MVCKNEVAIIDLFKTINDAQSITYIRLCNALGRPTMMQMAYRAAKVIMEQINLPQLIEDYNIGSTRTLRARKPKFILKIEKFLDDCKEHGINNEKPRTKESYGCFRELTSFRERSAFLRAMTNTLFLDHLESRGWVSRKPGCQFPGCSSQNDNLAHTTNDHIDVQALTKKEKNLLVKAINKESKTGENGRYDLDLSPTIAALLAKLFGTVKEPFLEAKRKVAMVARKTRKSVAAAAVARARRKIRRAKTGTSGAKRGRPPRTTSSDEASSSEA